MMSCKYENDFLVYRDKWVAKLANELNKELNHLDGAINVTDRMVYRDRKEIPSLNIRVILLVDKGEFFKETVAFDIYIEEEMDIAILTENYTWIKKTFAKNDVKKIAGYIINNTKEQMVKSIEKKFLKVK